MFCTSGQFERVTTYLMFSIHEDFNASLLRETSRRLRIRSYRLNIPNKCFPGHEDVARPTASLCKFPACNCLDSEFRIGVRGKKGLTRCLQTSAPQEPGNPTEWHGPLLSLSFGAFSSSAWR